MKINVDYRPDHEVGSDPADLPVLQFTRDGRFWGWRLYYLDDTDGVETVFTPGDITDVDDAVRETEAYLQWVAASADETA
jgi:hypothetical protein